MPFVYYNGDTYSVPSMAIIQYILEKISPDFAKMHPQLGSIGERSIRKLHEQGYHPVSYYSKYVMSNPQEADSFRCGPYLMWLHDLGHVFWMSLLTKKEREIIFSDFIVPLETLLKDSKLKLYDNETPLKLLIGQLHDFNLTPVYTFSNSKTRLSVYINAIYQSVLDSPLEAEQAVVNLFEKHLTPDIGNSYGKDSGFIFYK
jgi:hypothetical protein